MNAVTRFGSRPCQRWKAILLTGREHAGDVAPLRGHGPTGRAGGRRSNAIRSERGGRLRRGELATAVAKLGARKDRYELGEARELELTERNLAHAFEPLRVKGHASLRVLDEFLDAKKLLGE
jgi:hypothetical protein